jgi:hypothetical protein
LIFSISVAKVRKVSNRDFWDCFSRLLGPMPESLQIRTSGIDFPNVWGQRQGVIKSGFLKLMLPTSEPVPESH